MGLIVIRMFLTAIGFLIILMKKKSLHTLTIVKTLQLFGIGIIVCLHWLCFYQSIKEYNSSSIALVCLGISPMFVVWIEYFSRITASISREKILISFIAIIGMCFIVQGKPQNLKQSLSFGHYEWAIIYGVLSSLLASIFTIMNGKMSQNTEPTLLSFVEMLSGGIFLFIYIAFFHNFDFVNDIDLRNGFYIVVLSFVCTNLPFILSIYALKKLEPFVVTLTVNLEPLYGLFFAAILFQEHETFNSLFFIGVLLILSSVFLPLLLTRWKRITIF